MESGGGADLFVCRSLVFHFFEPKGGGLWRRERYGRGHRLGWTEEGFGKRIERFGELER